ncbi:uncharacterized protein C8Q71DRAFT_719940 [Rhodofomes roseus]|uniref:Uncharacterized protein n=1 Tax=Rhodofomes roseus TaxID=34475 RepID=A0ABQ8KU69_9APHY|nr:uncharacterized protein C8Q71DRAFT_719940 [Rhodofomes roseus]KAH9842351.1 hypothetical protein C8Q71DRAFT_719940 [Rhodofomes roseus]
MLLACTCLLFFALRYVLHVSGETRFIDDTYGDPEMGIIPSYSIANCWNNESSCPGCVLHPDASQAYDGTWHETTSNECNGQDNNAAGHSVAFNFIGTTLTIFAITVSQGPQSWQTNLSFNLDGETSYSTLFQSSLGETYEFSYAVPVFNISWLDNVLHTFTMTASQGTAASTVHFDYATYWWNSDRSLPLLKVHLRVECGSDLPIEHWGVRVVVYRF